MNPNNANLPKRKSKMTYQTLPPKKLLSSPIVTSRIMNLQKPKPQVFVNLVDRFNCLKENVIKSPKDGFKTIKLSDESNMYIKRIENNSPVSTATLQTLAKRGISITPTSSSKNIPNGRIIKFENDTVSPVIIDWFKCTKCPGHFIKKQDLLDHENDHHSTKKRNQNFGIPVVDLTKDECRDKLSELGIKDFLTITNMNETDGSSSFGIPIVSLQGPADGKLFNILGAEGVLALGSFNEIFK